MRTVAVRSPGPEYRLLGFVDVDDYTWGRGYLELLVGRVDFPTAQTILYPKTRPIGNPYDGYRHDVTFYVAREHNMPMLKAYKHYRHLPERKPS